MEVQVMKRRIQASEARLLDAITERAHLWFPDRDLRDIRLDLIATHLTCPLRLGELLDADDTNFIHDIAGIERHLNRRTFKLEDCFLPRFADLERMP
jgi:hypothetical protein